MKIILESLLVKHQNSILYVNNFHLIFLIFSNESTWKVISAKQYCNLNLLYFFNDPQHAVVQL